MSMDIGEFDRAAVLWDIWDSADSWGEYETRRIALQETQAATQDPSSTDATSQTAMD